MNTSDPEKKSEPRREADLFEAAAQLAGAERGAFLNGACHGDPALRQRLEALLAAHGNKNSFLEPEAPKPENKRVQTVKLAVTDNVADETVGTTIGRYKILEKVGEGGCGVVYVAQQNEPVRRRVALKVIKLGMETKEVIARFEAERQALAMMDHPNIAKVFDAGTTENGRPFFVMELVRGIKITEYCDQNQLNTKARLDLVIEVCHAVQHAHQKGIIHRDIKPSNILVTLHDGVPVSKVIDFGIAKATEGRLTAETVYTQLHQFIGTPAYMSPEQAEMSGLDIDTRSDIYSLGVLLYELLAGSTPFDAKELIASGLDAMRKIIREQEPVRPSTRFATLQGEELSTTAKRRSTDTSKLLHQLKGDLDWIVMKCLEKDRTRRYETANGLAYDIERHINNEPVLACPPSTLYLLQKIARRNRAALTFAALMAAVLVAATGVSTWQAVRATRAETLANERLDESEAVSKFMTGVFSSPDPMRNGGRNITVAETMDRAVTNLDHDLAAQPELRARLQSTLGVTYWSLGLYREAIPLQEKARDYYLKNWGLENKNTLIMMNALANSYSDAGRTDEALKLREQVLKLRRKVSGPEHPATIGAMNNLAVSYAKVGREDDAFKLRQEVLALNRKLFGPENPDTIKAMNNLATSYIAVGRKDEAIKLLEEALTLDCKVLGPENPFTLQVMGSLANSYAADRKEEALKLREQMLTLERKVNGPEHPDTLEAMNNLAISYYGVGRNDEAIKLLKEALPLDRKVFSPDHPASLRALQNLALACSAAGRKNEALKREEELLTLERNLLGPQRPDMPPAMNGLAWTLATGDVAMIRNGTNAVRFAEAAVAATHRSNPDFLDTLAAAYAETQQFDEAAATEQEAIGLYKTEAEKNDCGARLKLYQAHRPYREPRKP